MLLRKVSSFFISWWRACIFKCLSQPQAICGCGWAIFQFHLLVSFTTLSRLVMKSALSVLIWYSPDYIWDQMVSTTLGREYSFIINLLPHLSKFHITLYPVYPYMSSPSFSHKQKRLCTYDAISYLKDFCPLGASKNFQIMQHVQTTQTPSSPDNPFIRWEWWNRCECLVWIWAQHWIESRDPWEKVERRRDAGTGN